MILKVSLATIFFISFTVLGCSGILFAQRPTASAESFGNDTNTFAFQDYVERLSWSWNKDEADPMYCARRYASVIGYQFEMSPKGSSLKISLLKDGKAIYSWRGHFHSVFCAHGNQLFFIQWAVAGSGGDVVAVDLTTGKELWRKPLKALGFVIHSSYSSYFNIEIGQHGVVVTANELFGRYVEVKSKDTGETIAHKLFKPSGVTYHKELADYQKEADTIDWIWDDMKVGPLHAQPNEWSRNYEVTVAAKGRSEWQQISISNDAGEIASWRGHRFSVLRIVKDRLFYADWSPKKSGGSIVAVDLKTGDRLWKKPLVALGVGRSPADSNLLNLETNSRVVTIWGKESLGRYVEFKSLESGETVGHRVFSKAKNPATTLERDAK